MSGRARRERAARGKELTHRQGQRRRLVLVVVPLVLAVAAAAAVAATRGSSPIGIGRATHGRSAGAPLQLTGIDPVTGKAVSLANYPDRPIVLNMWASWCTGCHAEARALATFARTHPQAQVVGVDIQDSTAGAKAFYRRFGWRHPSIFDPSGLIAERFRLSGLPATLFLDRRHRIVARILGATDLAGFDAGFERAQS